MDWTTRIGRRLSPRDLHVFMTVAELGSMAKAAERLAISRPVVSKSLAALEHALGVTLFDRGPGGVEPTCYGEVLLRRGRAVFDELRQSVEEVATLADPNAATLRIGSSEINAASLVAVTMERLLRRYPRMTFDVQQGNVLSRMQLLRERRVDVFVARLLTPQPDPDIEAVRLLNEEYRIACGARSHWGKRRRVTLQDLLQAQWVQSKLEMAPGGPTYEAFRAAGFVPPEVRIFSDSLSQRFRLLEIGDFVTLIAMSVLRLGPTQPNIRTLPIALRAWEAPTVVATLRHRTITPAAAIFIAEIRAVAALV